MSAAKPAAAARQPGILYVLAGYPRPSETFIRREVEALARRPVRLWLYALADAAPPPGSPPLIRGAAWSRREIAAALARCVVSRPAALSKAFAGLAAAWRHPLYALKAWRHAVRALPLAAVIDSREVDWIHAHFADLPTEIALFLCRLTGRRLSFSAHARDVFAVPVRLEPKCRRAEAVFACSRAAMDALPALPQVHLVHHGLDLADPVWSEIYADRHRRLLEARRPEGPVRLLAVGRFVSKKGFHVLLEALEMLGRRGVELECRILGGGPEHPRLARHVVEHDLTGRVELADFQPREALAREWRRSDLLVHPAIIAEDGDRDGIPNGILEAMACGLPVLGSDLPSIREVIRDGDTGFLAPAGDPAALADRLESALGRDPRAQLGIMERAEQQIRRRFDVETNVESMLNFWNFSSWD